MNPTPSLKQVFERELSALCDPDVRLNPPDSVSLWRIPRPDAQALRKYGLPQLEEWRLQFRLQDHVDPELSAGGGTGYRLGREGLGHALMTVEGDGSVIGVPILHGFESVCFNSNLSSFVDLAWRWYWVCVLLEEEDEDDYELIERVMAQFRSHVLAKDPLIRATQANGWFDLIDAYLF